MGLDDKIRNAAEEAAGKVKEKTGQATDNEQLEAEGKSDQVKANVKQAGEKVKDAAKDATDSLKRD
ncbi:CsbD family protein [Arthrobacter celericrescens]|uniref:CsbD family protein n=1 Tax=Arthrobacter celericrescens TaxID=2320851 RepID=UPI000EA03491|nr:CsbD family protein [Arthrobacter celericrescens]